MSDTLTLADLRAWIDGFAATVADQRTHLTDLDAAIGDADHGANLARGMGAVTAALDAAPPEAADALFKKVGMTLVSSVGGASGPLYGTFFLRLGTSAGAVTELDAPALLAALRAGLEGVIARGKATTGEKTMIDALDPALTAFAEHTEEGVAAASAAAAAAAASGRDATAPLQATKGRASYLGERSVGHVDPGAASATMLLAALAEVAAR